MLLFINVFLLIFNVIPKGGFCRNVETVHSVSSELDTSVKEGQERNGRLIGLLGLLADSLEEDDELEPERRNQVINTRTSSDWGSSLKFAYVHPNGKVELLLNPNAYQDLLLHHYYQHYPQNNRHGAKIQTIKVSSSSINPIQTSSPIQAETTVINDLPQIEINKKADLRSGSSKDKKRKVSNNDGKRAQKLMETTTIDVESEETTTDIQSTVEPITVKRWKKEAEVTTLPTTGPDETTYDTTLDTTEVELTTTIQPEQADSDSLTEGSSLSHVLLPPSHTIATFKPTVPMSNHYGLSSLNNIDLIYLTTMSPPSHKIKTLYKFRPSPRDYFLDKKHEFVPLYFKDVNSNHFELPLSDTVNNVLYEFEPLLN